MGRWIEVKIGYFRAWFLDLALRRSLDKGSLCQDSSTRYTFAYVLGADDLRNFGKRLPKRILKDPEEWKLGSWYLCKGHQRGRLPKNIYR